MKILELFSSTQSISSVFKANGWDAFTIEKDSSFEDITTWTVGILEATAADILEKFGRPDVIWTSPPFGSFSVAAIGRNWTKLRKRRSRTEARASRAGLKATQQNTRANRRTTANVLFYGESTRHDAKMPQVQGMPMYTVTYCQYGENRMKPTDIWTNHEAPNFRPMCKNGAPCQETAPRGSKGGVQGQKDARERSRIPKRLCEHIYELCKKI